jgi:tRNA(fMet)-specific endonuclease VapC
VNPVYLLDTNTVSYILTGRSPVARKKLDESLEESAISVITEAELRYGLARKQGAHKLTTAVERFLEVVAVLPWDSGAAKAYALMRAKMTARGKTLSAMDMLIAAQASAVGACLVTSDRAFEQVDGLFACLNWATDL